MKRKLFYIALIIQNAMNKLYLLFICLFSITDLYSQDLITEANYLKEDSIIWMNYEKRQAQATPTCFLTDKQHIVKVKCTGLHIELFNKYINHSK